MADALHAPVRLPRPLAEDIRSRRHRHQVQRVGRAVREPRVRAHRRDHRAAARPDGGRGARQQQVRLALRRHAQEPVHIRNGVRARLLRRPLHRKARPEGETNNQITPNKPIVSAPRSKPEA
eukprot:8261132-Pyramimonas_sp.AAC.2